MSALVAAACSCGSEGLAAACWDSNADPTASDRPSPESTCKLCWGLGIALYGRQVSTRSQILASTSNNMEAGVTIYNPVV